MLRKGYQQRIFYAQDFFTSEVVNLQCFYIYKQEDQVRNVPEGIRTGDVPIPACLHGSMHPECSSNTPFRK